MKHLFPLAVIASLLVAACGASEGSSLEAVPTPADFRAAPEPTVSPSSMGPTPLIIIYSQNRKLPQRVSDQIQLVYNVRTCLISTWDYPYTVANHPCFGWERPDLILMDAQIWNGPSTAQEVDNIRRLWTEWLPAKAPIVLMSENSRAADFTAGLDVQGFLDLGTEDIAVNNIWDDAFAYLGTWLSNPVYDQYSQHPEGGAAH